MAFNKLKKELLKKDEFDINRIQKAYDLAEKVHKGQKRKSGEDFIVHPVEVAETLFRIGGDENIICAGLLHDVIEDNVDKTEGIEDEICNEFGYDVFFLVQALSKDNRIEDSLKKQEDYFKRLQEAMEMDISIFFLKMADLIHNMKTLRSLKPEKQKKWINELQKTYIPMMSDYFHHISFHYHDMYLNLLNELESAIEEYEVT